MKETGLCASSVVINNTGLYVTKKMITTELRMCLKWNFLYDSRASFPPRHKQKSLIIIWFAYIIYWANLLHFKGYLPLLSLEIPDEF